MTRIERIQTVMAGGIPDRVPVMTHNFLMAAREAGVTMAQYRSSADVIANHNRRKFVFLRHFFEGIQPAALTGLAFANLLKWYLCRLKPQLIRAISKIALFMPLLRNRSYPRFAFISP